MGKKWWAIVQTDGYDLLDFVEAESPEEAVKAYVEKAHVPSEDAALLQALDGEKVRDDVQVDGIFLPAIEYGPEFAFGPEEATEGEWDAYRRLVREMKEKGVRVSDIVGWLRVNSTWDVWCPVVK
jgi:hypothetical protein